MDPSLQMNTNTIHHTHEHLPKNQFDISLNHHHHHQFLDNSKPHQLPFTLPLPNFLIDPQDGQFTPYFDRSPASSPGQEYDDPMEFNHHSSPSSPMNPLSPLRSRATSIALKKLIDIQAQRLLDISAAWKKKYPPDQVDIHSDRNYEHRSCSSSSSSYQKSPVLFPKLDPETKEFQKDQEKEEEDKKEIKQKILIDWNTSKPMIQHTRLHQQRHHRCMSEKSMTGISMVMDRLSLNEYSHAKGTHPSKKIDVELWKREVLESQLKLDSTKLWILGLPITPDQFEQSVDDVDVDSNLDLTPLPPSSN